LIFDHKVDVFVLSFKPRIAGFCSTLQTLTSLRFSVYLGLA
jgi:hypothetical protein